MRIALLASPPSRLEQINEMMVRERDSVSVRYGPSVCADTLVLRSHVSEAVRQVKSLIYRQEEVTCLGSTQTLTRAK